MFLLLTDIDQNLYKDHYYWGVTLVGGMDHVAKGLALRQCSCHLSGGGCVAQQPFQFR